MKDETPVAYLDLKDLQDLHERIDHSITMIYAHMPNSPARVFIISELRAAPKPIKAALDARASEKSS